MIEPSVFILETVADPTLKPREAEKIAALTLVRKVLGDEVVIDHHENGAPFIPSRPDIFISISHSRRRVVVALSKDCPIGVDIEDAPEDRIAALLPRVSATNESTDQPRQRWMAKEAAFKVSSAKTISEILISQDLSFASTPSDPRIPIFVSDNFALAFNSLDIAFDGIAQSL